MPSSQPSTQGLSRKFTEANSEWNLSQLETDLAQAKRTFKRDAKRSMTLTAIEKTCLRGLLCGYSPTEIAIELNRDTTGLRVDLSRGLYEYIQILVQQRPRDWKQVPIVLERAGYRKQVGSKALAESSSTRHSLSEVFDLTHFQGRTAELNQFITAIEEQRCRTIALMGMGGIGKTALAAKWVQTILEAQSSFECVIWRSLRHVPSIQEMLIDLLQVLADPADLPPTEDRLNAEPLISQVLFQLREQRCLVILDDWDSVLQQGKLAGYCIEQYEEYGRLLKRIAEEQHQSCLVVISREKPIEFTTLQGTVATVIKLKGLQSAEAEALLAEKGFAANMPGLTELIHIHRGNPAALKIVATTIQELFDGNITQFLNQTSLVLGDVLTTLLDQQFQRLSHLEKQVMYWLGIAGHALTLSQLKADAEPTLTRSELITALESLRRRSLLDKTQHPDTGEVLFTLEPVVMKYVTQQLVNQVCVDLQNVIRSHPIEQLGLLRSHALLKKPAADEVKQRQQQMILDRVRDRLQTSLGRDSQGIQSQLTSILDLLRGQTQTTGYAEINVSTLLERVSASLLPP